MKAYRYIVTIRRSLEAVDTVRVVGSTSLSLVVPAPVPMEGTPEAELWLSIAPTDACDMVEPAARLEASLAALAESGRLLKDSASPNLHEFRPKPPSPS